MVSVTIGFEDGRIEQAHDDSLDLSGACSFSLALADKLGQDFGDGHGPPRWVHIIRNAKTELSISVIRGGLLIKSND